MVVRERQTGEGQGRGWHKVCKEVGAVAVEDASPALNFRWRRRSQFERKDVPSWLETERTVYVAMNGFLPLPKPGYRRDMVCRLQAVDGF